LVPFVWYIEGDLRLRVLFSQMLSRVHTRRVKETRPQAKPAPVGDDLQEQLAIYNVVTCVLPKHPPPAGGTLFSKEGRDLGRTYYGQTK